MSTQVQVRGAATATQAARTLASRELDVDTTKSRINIHNGSTVGGIPHANCFDIQNQEWTYATATGTNSIAVALNKAPAAYAAGQKFSFKAAATITTSATLNINALGAKTIKKVSGGALAALVAGDIVIGGIYECSYDGTDMILMNVSGSSSGPKTVVSASGASIDFPDIFTSGKNYRVELNKIRTNDNVQLYLLLATSGSSWITSGNYKYRTFGVGVAGTLQTAGSESGGAFQLTPLQHDSTDGDGFGGTIWIENPASATRALKIHGQLVYREVGNATMCCVFGGEYNTDAAMGSFQLDLDGANTFTDGSVSVYEYSNT